jgi:hypothetical protein
MKSSRWLAAASAAVLLVFLPLPGLSAQGPKASFDVEFGGLKVLSHTYRVGAAPANSDFNFVTQGGQEILFPFGRLEASFLFGGRHEVGFLYQPLELDTKVNFPSTVTVDGKAFLGPTAITYGFPFYRLTYQYRFLDRGDSWLGGGLAIQLRNASIRFESLDGSPLAVSQNLGIVPALALSGHLAIGGPWFAAFEATGIYASSALFNGADFQFEGSLLDASARLGFAVNDSASVYLNVRFLGGSAAGISQYPRTEWTNSTSPETENRLATMSFTIGASVH